MYMIYHVSAPYSRKSAGCSYRAGSDAPCRCLFKSAATSLLVASCYDNCFLLLDEASGFEPWWDACTENSNLLLPARHSETARASPVGCGKVPASEHIFALSLLMLRRMPSGPTNRMRRQLAGAAAGAVAVCSLSALGEVDQHSTSPQQHGEEPRKRICTLRSHMRDAVERRGTGQQDKGERFPHAQPRTPPAPSGGKQQQQKEDQRPRQTQHHSTIRSTRLSRHDAAASPEGEQLTPTKRPDTSTASVPTADSKEAAADEKSVERESSAAIAPVTTGGTAVPPAEAGSGSVTSEAEPPSAAATEGEEGASENSSFQDAVEVRETVSRTASVKQSCTNSHSDASSANLCQLDTGATQREEGGVRREDHVRIAELASEDTAKISAGTPWGEALSINKAESPEKDQPLLGQQGYRWTSPPHRDEIQRTEPEATSEFHPACGVCETASTATLQDKRDSLIAAVSDTLETRTVHAVSRRDSPLHQRVSPAGQTAFFEESSHHWQRKAAEGSDSLSLTRQRSPSQEQPKAKKARQPPQEHTDAYQVPSACFEVQAVPQGMQTSQAAQQKHTSRGEQLLPPKEEQLPDRQKVLHKAQEVLQRSEESAEPSQPPSLEVKDEQQNYTADIGELGRQLFCTPGGAGGRQGCQQVGKSDDIRFFLRLGGAGTSLWRSVHVSNAFLKDSWRAQRFFCRLFGVEVGDVVGLVDEQGFVSPFDGEELFIRNGGTYTLELAPTKIGEVAGSGGQCVSAGSLSSGRHINRPALECDSAAGGASCDREAMLTRARPAAAFDAGSRAAWQQAFATQCLPVKNGHTSVVNSESNQSLGVPTARAASTFSKQTAQQALCKEGCSAALIERAAGTRRASEVVHGHQRDRMFQDVLLAPSNHTSGLPPSEQPVWGTESGTGAAAGSRMSIKNANGKTFVYGGGDDNADIRNRKDVSMWAGAREVPRDIPGLTGAGGAAARHTRSVRQPGHVADMPRSVAQEIRNSKMARTQSADELLHGQGMEQLRAQTYYNQAEGSSLQGLQEAREGVAEPQRTRRKDENWQVADPPAAGGQAGGRVKQDWGSLSPRRCVENGSSTGVTKQDHFVAELGTKLSKLEDDHVSSRHQLVESQRASSGSPSFLPEQAPPKKQQQSRRASKLWISAPLLAWRRRRLGRSLALHDAEDPVEVATRQLMAEEHVRAVLARVSQRKALRNHVQPRPPGAEEQPSDTDNTSGLVKKETVSTASAASTAQREGANKGTILSRPSQRSSAAQSEPLLVDSLLWKKISTEKIYVHQSSSYRSAATYARKESAVHADAHEGLRRMSCLPYSKDHVGQQHAQQYRRQHPGETESPLERDTPDSLTCKEATGELKAKKLEEEEGKTSRFSTGTRDYSGSARQYMLRPRLTNVHVRDGAQVEKKAHSSLDDGNSLRRVGELIGGEVRGDTAFNSDNSTLHPSLADERQEGGFQSFVSRRSSNANASGAGLVQPSKTQSRMGGDGPEGRSVGEKTGFQGCAGRAEESTLAGSQGSTKKNGARSQAASDPEGSECVSSETTSESNGDSCEWKTQLCGGEYEKQLQQVLGKQLFIPAELQRQVEMLETLKGLKQQPQLSRSLLSRLKVLLPPQTYDNIKLLLPSLLKTAERVTGTDAKEGGELFQKKGCGPQMSSTASHLTVSTTEGKGDACEEKKAMPSE